MSYLRRALRNVWTAVVMSGMCWCQSVEPPAPSILAGRVVGQLDGKPIKGAVVQLHNSSSGFPMPGAAFSGRTSTTSENGAYAFSNVEPGNYRLLVQREGYTPGVYGGRYLPGAIVEVAASQSWKNLDIEMSPHGSISGVVTNADGQAAQRVHVSALRIGFASGRRSFTPYSFTDTDAEGSFMLKGLPAGRYSIRVDQGAGLRVAGSADKRQRGVLEQTIARTYYPNAETIEAAIPVPVDPGAEVTGIRVRRKARRDVPCYGSRGLGRTCGTGERVCACAGDDIMGCQCHYPAAHGGGSTRRVVHF